MAAPRVIFVHGSKTGGTTLRDVLRRQYGPDRVREVNGYRLDAEARELAALPATTLAGIDAFYGHMPVGLAKLIACPCAYITLVRDPVERIISHYHWVLRTPSARLHDEVVSRRMSLRSYVLESSGARFFNNGQTRILGAPSMVSAAAPTSATLGAAKRNLDRFAVAGLTERFEESLLLMRRELGWRWPIYRSLNVSPRRPRAADLSGEDREAITECNRLDIDLHAHVAGGLEERIERVRRELEWDLVVLRALNGSQAGGWPTWELGGRAA
jgi:hypothetical protein